MIRRSPRPDVGWTTLDNRVIVDDELSFRSLGILTYILSKPNDWRVSAEDLAATHTEGRDAVRSSLEQLEDAGYAVNRKFRVRGQYQSEWVIYDLPQGRNLPDYVTSAGNPRRLNRAGEPGPLTRTENQGLRRSTRGPSSGTAQRSRVRAEAEDHGDDDAPAMGADPRSRRDRNDVAAERGMSGRGLAVRLQRKLAHLEGSAATVDVGLLGKRLNQLHRAGTHSWELLAACVEVYAGAPDRYRSGDLKGWTQFLAAMPKLEKDAENRRRAETPAHVLYGDDPYANAVD